MIPEIRLEINMLTSEFQLNQGLLARQLRDPIAQDLVRRGLRVVSAARRNATQRPGPRVITGRLRASIAMRVGNDAAGPYVDVGTAVSYAPYVELGHSNTAHVYPIVSPGGTFTGRFGYVGNNPTRPYPFLRPALQAARVSI